tara:strand:- start:1378 stop:2163 length:786 start_codon:yes stop_codon:yes gene_type:complete
MITIILTISILINLLLIFYINKKKLRNFLNITKVKKTSINELHEIFSEKKISNVLKGPKKETIVKNFCISSDNNIVGMTSDYEAWILSVLSTVSKKIFEFGTCSGKTTYLMALNSNMDTEITTITLRQNQTDKLFKDNKDNNVSFRNIIDESIYEKFLFSDTDAEKKINVIFENSLNFDENKYHNTFDLIFIDGGHTYSIVKNDSEKSFRMLKDNGIILWHDYVPGKESAKNVVKYLNEISNEKNLFHIRNTSLCFFKKNI